MAEDEKKPVTITIKVTIPNKESIVAAIKQLFPLLEVTVEEEKKPVKTPSTEVITPNENMTGYETPVAPPGTVFETPTKKPGEAP